MTSPLYYILVALTLTSATISIIFLMVWWFLGRKPYAISWAVGFFAATAQWLCNLLGASFPSYEAYWLTVNGLGLILVVLGLLGMAAAVGYVGPGAYGYRGGGELAVFVFFGLVAVAGSYFVQTLALTGAVLGAAASMPLSIPLLGLLQVPAAGWPDTHPTYSYAALGVLLLYAIGLAVAWRIWGGFRMLRPITSFWPSA